MDGKKERIDSILTRLVEEDDWTVLEAWNEFADTCGYERVYQMDEFNDTCGDEDPLDIASEVYYGDFNPTHEYFWFDGYGNLVSSDFFTEMPIDTGELADWAVDHAEDYGIGEIGEILDEDDDEDETA